jgi:hypothetical protein
VLEQRTATIQPVPASRHRAWRVVTRQQYGRAGSLVGEHWEKDLE